MLGMKMRKAAWLGVSALLGAGTTSHAGDFFHRLHGSHGSCGAACNSETVTLPAQRVVVETTRPRIVVQETVRERIAPTPYVASFYQPMVMPFLAAPTPVQAFQYAAPPAQECVKSRVSPFAALHELEERELELAQSRAAHDMQVRAAQQIYTRIAAMRDASNGGAVRSSDCEKQIRDELEKIKQRVENVEKLVIVHDEAIKSLLTKKTP